MSPKAVHIPVSKEDFDAIQLGRKKTIHLKMAHYWAYCLAQSDIELVVVQNRDRAMTIGLIAINDHLDKFEICLGEIIEYYVI